MLFKEKQLEAIKAGKVSLAFRCWAKPAVLEGSLLKTAAGVLKILEIKVVKSSEISTKDCHQAGFEDIEHLMQSLRQNEKGQLYRIRLKYHSEDPRIELRTQSSLTTPELEALTLKLQKLDKLSKAGPWTRKILSVIKANPRKRAVDIAKLTGFEKEWLKLNIRKLKNLGLTISHEIGYELSPLGEFFFASTK